MSVKTVNGAELPTAPASEAGGFRGYEASGVDRVREEASAAIDGGVDTVRDAVHQSVDLVSAILTVVIAGAAAYAGINVMSNVAGTMSLSEGDMFYNASQNLEQGIGSFFSQMPTVFVVIALVLIIGYLTVLRR